MYKIYRDRITQEAVSVNCLDGKSIPFGGNNSDYANFKREINEDKAQLQDADGNLMTAQAAKNFIKTLP